METNASIPKKERNKCFRSLVETERKQKEVTMIWLRKIWSVHLFAACSDP
jgi:hypothetical protein